MPSLGDFRAGIAYPRISFQTDKEIDFWEQTGAQYGLKVGKKFRVGKTQNKFRASHDYTNQRFLDG